jgi:hypothetical protein
VKDRVDSRSGLKWSAERYAGVAERSLVLHGNSQLLPVALAFSELGQKSSSVPQVYRHLGGEVPAHRVLEALRRLEKIGAVEELPYVGRPHPREFERRDSPYWEFAFAYSAGAHPAR